MRTAHALLTLLLALTSARADTLRQTVAFRVLDEGDIAVPVTIDGQGPYRCLLDTGSSRSAVSSDLARRLGLARVGETLMVTPGGRILVPLARLRVAALGDVESVNVVVMVLARDRMSRRGDIDGLIGQDVLGERAFTIDYETKRLSWPTIGEASSLRGSRLPLAVEDGRALVSLAQGPGVNGVVRLIPDSGADRLVLFDSPGRRLPRLTPLDSVGLRTLSGPRAVRRVLVDDLDVGAIRLRDQVALLIDRPASALPLGDGLLPLHLFARVTFNRPDGYLVVEAR